jgi:hypothetical protein
VALPFLTYLTVFKSRLGLANVVLGVTGFANQSAPTVIRKVRQTLEAKEELDLTNRDEGYVFQYLRDKKLVGEEARAKGRYAGYTLEGRESSWLATSKRGGTSTLPVYKTDIWMAAPEMPSTIGVPTPDNAEEVVELAVQLRLISKSTNTWTAAGQVINTLRGLVTTSGRHDNPFLLRAEGAGLLRQVLQADGVMLRAMVPFLIEQGPEITRPQVAEGFGLIVEEAVTETKRLGVAPMQLRDVIAFQKLIRDQTQKLQKALEKAREQGRGQSRAPGVLEHRVSPRLEWLTDLGYLTKEGLPKNGFEYRATDALHHLSETMDAFERDERWADEVAIAEWHSNPYWKRIREVIPATPVRSEAIRKAYLLIRRRIGPSPLREVAFLAALLSEERISAGAWVDELIGFAQETDGVTVSRGRFRRGPENILITPAALEGSQHGT